MKRKDLATLIGVLIISVIVSVIAASLVFGSSSSHQQDVPVVDRITPDFPVSEVQGKDKQFNSQAIDPTQFIQIGNPNSNPFNSSTQQ